MYQKFPLCFGGDIYQQKDGVAMGSQLGSVLAGIFMVELETKTIPTIMERFLIGEDKWYICICKERLWGTCFSAVEFFP